MSRHFWVHGITPEEFLRRHPAAAGISRPGISRPGIGRPGISRPGIGASARDIGSNIESDNDKFQVNLDMHHFAPEEISVQTADGYVVVEGKHEEEKDQHGDISRQLTARYALPDGCVPESVKSKLSSDGVLSVTAPRKVPLAVQGEPNTPITQTGTVHKEVKDQANGDK